MDPNELRLIPVSPSEWQILTCVFDLGSATALRVSEQLRFRTLRGFGPKTTGILLARLAEKGYLGVTAKPQRRGRPIHTYEPLVSRETALAWQLERFLRDYLLTDQDLERLLAQREAAVKL